MTMLVMYDLFIFMLNVVDTVMYTNILIDHIYSLKTRRPTVELHGFQ